MFYLGLVNCTRTGGWVSADGTCRGYGSGRYSAYVAPLRHSPRHARTYVSRPYARLMASKNHCSHFSAATPADRLRRAGYDGSQLGREHRLPDGYTYTKHAVLASHLFFQSEKSTNGGHWRNIKNSASSWVGIGVWKYSGRVRLVVDFNA